MNPLFHAALDIQTFFAAEGWRSAVIGGLAVQRWGEPRQTRDVDLTLLTGLGREEAFVDAILTRYRARIADARQFALERRVLLIETTSGIPIDLSLAGLPFEARVIDRSTPFAISADATITTCSAEDLVVFKAFAGRLQDWVDIEGIVARQGARLNRALVFDELLPLLQLKEDETAEARLRDVFDKH